MASASVAANKPYSSGNFSYRNLSIKIEYYRTKYNLGQKNSFGKIPAPLNPLF